MPTFKALYKVADISYCQSKLDWNALVNAGFKGVIIRCGYLNKTDTSFIDHITTAIRYGLHIGIYTYIMSRNPYDALAEAEETINRIRPYAKYIDLGVWSDVEDARTLKDRDAAQISAITQTFLECIKSHGFVCGLYSNPSTLMNYYKPVVYKTYPVWLAHWAANSKYLPVYNPHIWQYGTEKINGTPVDSNYVFSDMSEITDSNNTAFMKRLNAGLLW